jgi:hypothetical protein
MGLSPIKHMVIDWLDSIFEDKMLPIKSRRGDTWAPSSSDINPLDFFLWGYLKEQVYKPLPSNLEEVNAMIKREVKELPQRYVRKSFFLHEEEGSQSCARKWRGF